MNALVTMTLLCVLGCSARESSSASRAALESTGELTSSERESAQTVPPSVTAEFVVDGAEQALGGMFQLRVGPGDEREYDFVGSSPDRKHRLEGQLDLKPFDDPTVRDVSRGVVFELAPTFKELQKSPLSWMLTDGVNATHYVGVRAKLRIDSDGLLAGEVTAVDVARIDLESQSALPGADVVIQLRGRATGACLDWQGGTPHAADGRHNPVLLDVRQHSDACKRLLAAW